MSADRFVVLCLGRTGSSHLVDLLDSHPGIRCYAEILNETHPRAAPEGWIGESGSSDAAEHVERLLTATDAPVAGFKLPLNSLRDHPEVAGWLRDDPAIRVIRLRRQNTLALLLSRRMLRATLVSQSIHGSYGKQTVTIEPRECLRALRRIEAEDAELDALASGHSTLDLEYARLGEDEELERAQRFLGVEPAPLSSRYERVRKRPFSATIENWEELSAALRPTRFAPLLEEREAG